LAFSVLNNLQEENVTSKIIIVLYNNEESVDNSNKKIRNETNIQQKSFFVKIVP